MSSNNNSQMALKMKCFQVGLNTNYVDRVSSIYVYNIPLINSSLCMRPVHTYILDTGQYF